MSQPPQDALVVLSSSRPRVSRGREFAGDDDQRMLVHVALSGAATRALQPTIVQSFLFAGVMFRASWSRETPAAVNGHEPQPKAKKRADRCRYGRRKT